jgi:hypothetical protein
MLNRRRRTEDFVFWELEKFPFLVQVCIAGEQGRTSADLMFAAKGASNSPRQSREHVASLLDARLSPVLLDGDAL